MVVIRVVVEVIVVVVVVVEVVAIVLVVVIIVIIVIVIVVVVPSKFVRAERAVCSMVSIAGQQPGFHLFNIAILIVLDLKVKVASTPLEF